MYDKILVPVDHSQISDRAVLAARDLAMLSNGEVWVLHLREREVAVRGGAALTGEPEDEANAIVAAAVDKLTEAGVKAHGEVRPNRPTGRMPPSRRSRPTGSTRPIRSTGSTRPIRWTGSTRSSRCSGWSHPCSAWGHSHRTKVPASHDGHPYRRPVITAHRRVAVLHGKAKARLVLEP